MPLSKHPALRNTVITSAEAIYYDAVVDAETLWQSTTKGTQAQLLAADITKHRTIVAAAITAGQPHLGRPSAMALHDLTGQWI